MASIPYICRNSNCDFYMHNKINKGSFLQLCANCDKNIVADDSCAIVKHLDGTHEIRELNATQGYSTMDDDSDYEKFDKDFIRLMTGNCSSVGCFSNSGTRSISYSCAVYYSSKYMSSFTCVVCAKCADIWYSNIDSFKKMLCLRCIMCYDPVKVSFHTCRYDTVGVEVSKYCSLCVGRK